MADELKEGYRVRGDVIIMASKFTNPLMSPVLCEGRSVVVNIKEDDIKFRPTKEKDPTEVTFFQARVEGIIRGTAHGRPMVDLDKVENITRVQPRWLKTE